MYRFALATLGLLLIPISAAAQGNYGGHGPIPVTWTNPVTGTVSGTVEASALGTTATTIDVGDNDLTLEVISCATTVGAEVSNVIEVAIACVDGDGDAVDEVQTLVVTLYSDAALTTISDGDIDIVDGGNGAIVVDYTAALSHLVYVTSATGTAELDITDQVGASGETHYLQIAGRMTGGRIMLGTVDTITFD